RVRRGDPMDGRLHLPSVGGVAAARGRIVSAVNFDDLALVVLDYTPGRDEVGIAQPNFFAGRKTEVALRRIFAEIVLLDIEHARKGNFAHAGALVFGIIDRFHFLGLALRIVVDDHLQRLQHGHNPGRATVQVFADKVFEHGQVDGAVGLGHADVGAKGAY